MTSNNNETDKVSSSLKVADAQISEISLKSFETELSHMEQGMDNWLRKFAWDKDTLYKTHAPRKMSDAKAFRQCPYNLGHGRISDKNYDKHVLKCALKSQKHQTDDIVGGKS